MEPSNSTSWSDNETTNANEMEMGDFNLSQSNNMKAVVAGKKPIAFWAHMKQRKFRVFIAILPLIAYAVIFPVLDHIYRDYLPTFHINLVRVAVSLNGVCYGVAFVVWLASWPKYCFSQTWLVEDYDKLLRKSTILFWHVAIYGAVNLVILYIWLIYPAYDAAIANSIASKFDQTIEFPMFRLADCLWLTTPGRYATTEDFYGCFRQMGVAESVGESGGFAI